MTTVILVLQFILAVILTISVLLQKSSSIGLGAYSGSNESLFGAKGPAGFMAKFTFIVGFLFVINTLALGYFYNKDKKASVIEDVEIEKSVPSMPSVPTTPVAPEAPSAPIMPTQARTEAAQEQKIEPEKAENIAAVDEMVQIKEKVETEIANYLNANKINFEIGKDVITVEGKVTLDKVYKLLQKAPDAIVTIEGHTDKTGNAKNNKILSQERAEAVKEYLISKEMDSSRLVAIGYGAEKLLVEGDTKEVHEKNRRVEFHIK